MPSWLISLLVNLAIKIGFPYLIKLIPGIPQAILDIIQKLLEELQKPQVSNSAAKKTAIASIRKELQVSPQPGDLKKG